MDQYPSNPNDHFKIAEGYLLNDLNKAKLAFENQGPLGEKARRGRFPLSE